MVNQLRSYSLWSGYSNVFNADLPVLPDFDSDSCALAIQEAGYHCNRFMALLD